MKIACSYPESWLPVVDGSTRGPAPLDEMNGRRCFGPLAVTEFTTRAGWPLVPEQAVDALIGESDLPWSMIEPRWQRPSP